MTINSLSRNNRIVDVSLSSSELVEICNYIYKVKESEQIDSRLYRQMMIARELSQYGHIDELGFESISECYKGGKVDAESNND